MTSTDTSSDPNFGWIYILCYSRFQSRAYHLNPRNVCNSFDCGAQVSAIHCKEFRLLAMSNDSYEKQKSFSLTKGERPFFIKTRTLNLNVQLLLNDLFHNCQNLLTFVYTWIHMRKSNLSQHGVGMTYWPDLSRQSLERGIHR